MATVPFQIKTNDVAWDETLLEAENYQIGQGETIDLLVSDSIPNNAGTIYNSVRILLDYTSLVPDLGQWFVGAVVEALDDLDHWIPIAYQFSAMRNVWAASQRHIILQPNLVVVDVGIDDVVYPVDSEIARVSRQQGLLPESVFRVRVQLKDNDPQGANAWVQVAVSGSGEKYNV